MSYETEQDSSARLGLIIGTLIITFCLSMAFVSARGYGDGTDGTLNFTTTTKDYGNLTTPTDYNVSGNTLYLNLNRVYDFDSFNLGAGTILSTTNTGGVALYINSQTDLNIVGTVTLTNILSAGNIHSTWNTITSAGVTDGGNGGEPDSYQGANY